MSISGGWGGWFKTYDISILWNSIELLKRMECIYTKVIARIFTLKIRENEKCKMGYTI